MRRKEAMVNHRRLICILIFCFFYFWIQAKGLEPGNRQHLDGYAGYPLSWAPSCKSQGNFPLVTSLLSYDDRILFTLSEKL